MQSTNGHKNDKIFRVCECMKCNVKKNNSRKNIFY